MVKRVFVIVLDSFGVGALPDAAAYGDVGSNTLAAVCRSSKLHIPNLARWGLFNIDGVEEGRGTTAPVASYGRMAERSAGKDTTIGHWELGGLIVPQPLPTYPEGFPPEIISSLEKAFGTRVLCNKPYSGTQVIADFGREHVETGAPVVYTSADSVLQIAAHEDVIPPEELYGLCRKARDIMRGKHGVGRIIARPFTGEFLFTRTANRKDFSLEPVGDTMLDILQRAGFDTISVGKIYDIFAGRGISESIKTKGNRHGMECTLELFGRDFNGLCFVNLVDFDMLYGHRNDVDGYAGALSEFDVYLGKLETLMQPGDVVILTADHGCDPSTPSTDHSREYVPVLVRGEPLRSGVNLGTRQSFADLAATVLDCFGIDRGTEGSSFLPAITRRA